MKPLHEIAAACFAFVCLAGGQAEAQIQPVNSSRPAERIVSAKRPVVNASGERRYRVLLDPFYLESLNAEAERNGFKKPVVNDNSVRRGAEENEINTTRYAAHKFSSLLGKKPFKIISWAGSEFHIDAKEGRILRFPLKPAKLHWACTTVPRCRAIAAWADPAQRR